MSFSQNKFIDNSSWCTWPVNCSGSCSSCDEAEEFRRNDAERSSFEIEQDAQIQSQIDERRKLGIVEGRNWSGTWVAPHPLKCICMSCKPEEKALAWETPLCDMALLKEMKTAGAYFRYLEDNGVSWGGLAELEINAQRAAETPKQRAARLAKEAEQDRNREIELVNFSINRKEDRWTKNGTMTFRVPRPCKYADLFAKRICANCNSHVPEGQTRCVSMKGHLVCNQEFAGCWSHTQGTCIYVHPDEPQWADACSGKLCYEREHCGCTSRGERNCRSNCGIVWSPARFYLVGQERPQVNRFAAVSAAQNAHQTPPHRGGASAGGQSSHQQRANGGPHRPPQPPRGGGGHAGGHRASEPRRSSGSDSDGWQTQPKRR